MYMHTYLYITIPPHIPKEYLFFFFFSIFHHFQLPSFLYFVWVIETTLTTTTLRVLVCYFSMHVCIHVCKRTFLRINTRIFPCHHDE